MNQHMDLGKLLCGSLQPKYSLRRKELGSDARLSKNGMVFQTEAYAVEGLGHLCILRMNAFFGLMKMETAVLAVTGRDVPLLNLDWVNAAGKETLIAELYDTMLQPCPPDIAARFQAVKDRDGDLPEPSSKPHWYDSILLPFSYHKSGKKLSQRFNRAAEDYVRVFLSGLESAPRCDQAEKGQKVRSFAETLVAHGGPAVDMVTKLFGTETARRLILRHMYGVDD